MSDRALEGRRVLTQQFEMGDLEYAGGSWQSSLLDRSQWKAVGVTTAYNEQYIDLSGYELDDLTLSPTNVRIQDAGVYLFSGADQVFVMMDVITTERLTTADLYQIELQNNALAQSQIGGPLGPLDRSQVMYGLYRFFAHNNTQVGLPDLMLASRTARFGAGHPTAVSKLWCYRIMVMFAAPSDGQKIIIPAANFILNAEISKEADLPYMMRLKRSFELATGN